MGDASRHARGLSALVCVILAGVTPFSLRFDLVVADIRTYVEFVSTLSLNDFGDEILLRAEGCNTPYS